jgi:hypothetical protein
LCCDILKGPTWSDHHQKNDQSAYNHRINFSKLQATLIVDNNVKVFTKYIVIYCIIRSIALQITIEDSIVHGLTLLNVSSLALELQGKLATNSQHRQCN